MRANNNNDDNSALARSVASRTTSAIRRNSATSACGSASVTSTSVRMTASGVRNSWEALAANRRSASSALCSREIMSSNDSARSETSSRGPEKLISRSG